MSTKIASLAGLLVCFFLASALAAEEGAKIVTVSDEGGPVAGKMTVSEFHGTVPPATPGNRAISQMPGFPVTMGKHSSFAPSRGLVFADLNNDGTLEIVTSSTDKKIYAWDYTGTPVPGFPVTTIEMPQYAPSVGDLDGDGDLEIVQATRGLTSGGRLYAVDHQGNVLPGFPMSFNNNNVSSCPTLNDLDNDGDLEILVQERAYPVGYLRVVEADGTEWGSPWPILLDHVPTGTPAVGDVDADGEMDIVFYSYNSIYLCDVEGNMAMGWPRQVAGNNFSYQSPCLVDLDDDGDLEIIFGMHKSNPGCYAWHHDGTSMPGFPKSLGTWTYCPPVATDLEGDGEWEIIDGRAGVFSGSSPCLYVWNENGATKPGFPYYSPHTFGGGSEGPITVADINNDGVLEIFSDHNVMDTGQGFLFGVDANGNDLPDFPLRPYGFTYMNGATIGDVDGDGDYELGVLSYEDYTVNVNVYDLTGTYHPSDVAYETYHMKNEKGGLFGSADRLRFQGYFGLNKTVNIYVHDEVGYKAFLFATAGAAKSYTANYGWFYLDPLPVMLTVLFNAPITGTGEIKIPVNIPNASGLVGATIYLQGVTGPDPITGDGSTTNMLARTIQP